jgi:hypothetical protein
MGHWYDIFTGGLGKSTNPADYNTPVRQQGQIDQAIAQGLGTNRQAPQTAVGGPFRDAQLGQLGQLQGLANGTQRTAGELAAYRGAQQAGAQQQAMARMARGGDAVLAQRNAAGQMAGISSNAAGQAQRSALEGQMAAQGLLTQAAGQGRGQDSQIQLANMDAQLKQMGMDDNARLQYLSQMTGLNIAQLQAQIAAMNGATSQQGLLGPLLSAGGQVGAAAAMSDERVKKDISDAGSEIDEMLDGLIAKRYRYKDEERHGKGSRVGFMAQDLEKSRAGKDIVFESQDGKAIDLTKAIQASLASAARLNERLRKVEAKG